MGSSAARVFAACSVGLPKCEHQGERFLPGQAHLEGTLPEVASLRGGDKEGVPLVWMNSQAMWSQLDFWWFMRCARCSYTHELLRARIIPLKSIVWSLLPDSPSLLWVLSSTHSNQVFTSTVPPKSLQ